MLQTVKTSSESNTEQLLRYITIFNKRAELKVQLLCRDLDQQPAF